MLAEPTRDRWGVCRIGFVDDITDADSAAQALSSVVEDLAQRWETWRSERTQA